MHQVNETLAMPTDEYIEAVAEKVTRSESFDPKNLEDVAKHLNLPSFEELQEGRGGSWRAEAEMNEAEFQQLGVENPIDIMNRVENKAGRGWK